MKRPIELWSAEFDLVIKDHEPQQHKARLALRDPKIPTSMCVNKPVHAEATTILYGKNE